MPSGVELESGVQTSSPFNLITGLCIDKTIMLCYVTHTLTYPSLKPRIYRHHVIHTLWHIAASLSIYLGTKQWPADDSSHSAAG